MKKIRTLMLIAGSMLACLSCEKKHDIKGDPDWDYITYYTYVNESSSTITINAVSMIGMTGETKQAKFTIYKNKTLNMEYRRKNFRYPFSLFHSNETIDKLEVSNGKVVVKQANNKDNILFDLNQYTSTNEKPIESNAYTLYVTRYTYTFTDDFFQDGEPIE